jgi:hypothetical protein
MNKIKDSKFKKSFVQQGDNNYSYNRNVHKSIYTHWGLWGIVIIILLAIFRFTNSQNGF